MPSHKNLYIISPAWNEALTIRAFVSETKAVLAHLCLKSEIRITLVLVDDGSTDSTYGEVKKAKDSEEDSNFRIIGIQLSRNFGQQAAFQAGLSFVSKHASPKDFFILMDSDLQHPPKEILRILYHLNQGISHVQMIREDNMQGGFFKPLASQAFYVLFRKLTGIPIEKGSSDFRGFNYTVLRSYLSLTEKGRFNRGLFHWIGFEKLLISYKPSPRFAGSTKYSLNRMLSLCLTAVTQFSSKPLILSLFGAVCLSFIFCFVYFGYEIFHYLSGRHFVLGWPSIMFFVAFWSGLILLSQLMLAVYVSRIFDEVKARPVFIVQRTTEHTHGHEHANDEWQPQSSTTESEGLSLREDRL